MREISEVGYKHLPTFPSKSVQSEKLKKFEQALGSSKPMTQEQLEAAKERLNSNTIDILRGRKKVDGGQLAETLKAQAGVDTSTVKQTASDVISGVKNIVK